jgi:hypothetical protein
MKYRHAGYHDDDYRRERETRKPEKRGPREITTREATVVMRCWQCGDQQTPDDGIDTFSVCSNCNADLHCCRTCLHFDPAARFECRQPIEKAFRDKTVRNDCSPFEPRPVLDATGRRARSAPPVRKKRDDNGSSGRNGGARDAFDNLFK